MNDGKSVIIIGAGFAGLAAGIYARMNGYQTRIFELHDQPRGLCTSWNRKGFTFDGCIHWLVGSSPRSQMHDIWEETGISQGRQFIDMDEYCRLEDTAGGTLVFYTDIDRLEKHLLEFSPMDERPLREFIDGIRMCLPFDPPTKHDLLFKRILRQIKSMSVFVLKGRKMKQWMNITAEEFSKRFRDPLLKKAFLQIWVPEFSMFFMLFTFAWLHNRNAGYPLGGSKPMSEALENRYRALGGTIRYKSRVSRITTSENRATGIVLEDGSQHMADRIISAADGHCTIFELLEGKYINEKSRLPYEKWPLFPSLVYISFGVNRSFSDFPFTVSGLSFALKEPAIIADERRDWLEVHIFNQDPTLAPPGKTCLNVMFRSDYNWWKNIAKDRKKYVEKKNEIAETVTGLLEQRFPGISLQIEATDVATPLTFERYTGNWKGSFEGWLITPDNSNFVMRPMDQVLPGLKSFYMCGQWVEPGGGLPTSIMSAKRLIKRICREDGKKFRVE